MIFFKNRFLSHALPRASNKTKFSNCKKSFLFKSSSFEVEPFSRLLALSKSGLELAVSGAQYQDNAMLQFCVEDLFAEVVQTFCGLMFHSKFDLKFHFKFDLKFELKLEV